MSILGLLGRERFVWNRIAENLLRLNHEKLERGRLSHLHQWS